MATKGNILKTTEGDFLFVVILSEQLISFLINNKCSLN